VVTKYPSERKGRWKFGTPLHYNTVDMIVTEKTRTAKSAVRATGSEASWVTAYGSLPEWSVARNLVTLRGTKEPWRDCPITTERSSRAKPNVQVSEVLRGHEKRDHHAGVISHMKKDAGRQ